ncbi:MAG: hypothetical protein ABR974_06545 [Bacteroidales bacterium]|jgi:hypothetical protein
MKKQIIALALLMISVTLPAQDNKTDLLQNLEKNNKDQNVQPLTATLKSSSRLFADKDDLTSVKMVIQSGSTVNILGSDSTYFHVTYQDNEGFIFKKDAVVDEIPANNLRSSRNQMPNQANQQMQQQPSQNNQQNDQQANQQNDLASRLTYLENKYGTSMAALLNAGKIWRGMTGEMVRDSWGEPVKINKTFEGNLVKEEWLYTKTWLYIENDILSDWGPIKK